MIRIRIGETEVDWLDASESWIAQQINRHRQDGIEVCAQVIIHKEPVKLRLSTPGCLGRGGSITLNEREREVVELWKQMGLTSSDFTGGNFIAFLKRLQSMFP